MIVSCAISTSCWTEVTRCLYTTVHLLKPNKTGYHSIANRFFAEHNFKHVALLTADGALEAAPAMGCADIILDLVSTGQLI